jgi:hypothetical protein
MAPKGKEAKGLPTTLFDATIKKESKVAKLD